jgi:hypothetical protein
VSACIDIVSLPAVLPILAGFILSLCGVFSREADLGGFALLWLIPGAAIRVLDWSTLNDPLYLVLVPLLWTALAVGIPFLLGSIGGDHPAGLILPALGALALPLSAAASWRAFFAQETVLGWLLLILTMLPLGVSLSRLYLRALRGE